MQGQILNNVPYNTSRFTNWQLQEQKHPQTTDKVCPLALHHNNYLIAISA